MSEFGCRLEFDEKGKAVCEESGENYELVEGEVVRR
jgi:UDP-2-acetamido-3-amino-2,3-dideoxy-glucuronate N-acetyltransferase